MRLDESESLCTNATSLRYQTSCKDACRCWSFAFLVSAMVGRFSMISAKEALTDVRREISTCCYQVNILSKNRVPHLVPFVTSIKRK